jgi:hypothetical protein
VHLPIATPPAVCTLVLCSFKKYSNVRRVCGGGSNIVVKFIAPLVSLVRISNHDCLSPIALPDALSTLLYLNLRSGKKTLSELDANFLLSPDHPDVPRRLEKTRVTTRRLSPLDLCDAIVKHNLDTSTKFQAFAKRQRLEGDETWATWCMKATGKKLAETISMALQLHSAEDTLRFQGARSLA